MVVAHPPGGAPPVLHCGDARLCPEATRNQPILQGLVGRAVLVLDTTYADPAYCFPPQQDVLDWVLRAVKVCWQGQVHYLQQHTTDNSPLISSQHRLPHPHN